MSYEPLHHKYRPQKFADLVGQEAIATTLTNAIRTARIAPAYLFTGPRGTGKTSSARILAKSLNCLQDNKPTEKPCGVCDVCQGIAKGSALDVIEIDAASNTGVDNIREIIERAQFAPVQCRYKVYVVDECHMLSGAAFNALLKTLEEPPNRVVFVLATTDPQRVLPTIISRCQRFDFRRIPLAAMVAHLQAIATQEQINITLEALQLVAQVAQGGLRDAESLLDQLSLLSGQVTVERIWDLVGSVAEPDLLELLQAIAQSNLETLLDCARRILDRGKEPLTLLQNLASFYRDLLIAKTAPQRSDLVALTAPTWQALCEQATTWDISSILAGQQHLAKSEMQIKTTTQPRLWLEVTLLGLLPAANKTQPIVSSSRQNFQPPKNIPQSQHSNSQTQPSSALNVEPLETPVKPQNLPPIVQQDEQTSPPVPAPTTEVEPSPSTAQPISVTNSAIEIPSVEIWQQVLTNLEPMSTRELLRQMGQLIEFNGHVARIGMRSLALCNRAKAYLPNIQAAFETTFKREVLVKLELATATQVKNSLVKELPLTQKNSVPAISQTDEPNANSLTAVESSQIQPATQFQPGTTIAPATYTSTTSTEWEQDEVAIAAQRLADFFKGEIVRLNDDPALAQPLPESNLAPSVTPELDVPEAEADVEF